jgi:hypothetical protein
MRRGFMIAAATAALVLGSASAASAAAGWAIQPTPSPAGATSSSFAGVSCPSATRCVAVGSYGTSSAELTLAERWNGTAWAIQPTPNPSGAISSELSAVSCLSGTNCTAVGTYIKNSGAELTLAEHWNGSSWAIQRTPTPAGTTQISPISMTGVSCGSAASCTAVGSYFVSAANTYVMLAEHWNGRKWAIQATPGPSGAAETRLDGVSCPSAASCTATGIYLDSSDLGLPLAEHWNGSSWATQAIPAPSGATGGSGLSGVSCPSAASCTAAGSYTNSSGDILTLAEQWNGSSWAIQTTPNESFGAPAHSLLEGVSCASAASCTATGYFSNIDVRDRPLAEHWNGSSWAIQTARSPSGLGSVLAAVSCARSGSCDAVGWSQNHAGMETTLAEGR